MYNYLHINIQWHKIARREILKRALTHHIRRRSWQIMSLLPPSLWILERLLKNIVHACVDLPVRWWHARASGTQRGYAGHGHWDAVFDEGDIAPDDGSPSIARTRAGTRFCHPANPVAFTCAKVHGNPRGVASSGSAHPSCALLLSSQKRSSIGVHV